MAPLAETTALYEAISAGDVGPPPAAPTNRRRARRWSGATRSPVGTRRSSSCSRRSVRVASSWSRESRASARPASSRRSLARQDAAGADGALLRQRRRRALRPARRSAPARRRRSGDAPRRSRRSLRRSRRRRRGWSPSWRRRTRRPPPSTGPGPRPASSMASPGRVAAAGSAPPGVLVVDDAQWADDATQQVLAHLAAPGRRRRAVPDRHPAQRRGRRLRTALPCARRPAPRRRRRGHPARAAVGPESVAALVAGAVPADDADRVDRGGDPRERGAAVPGRRLPRRAGGWRGAPRPTSATCSRGRLASLTDGAAQLLTTASVIGRSFTFDVVRAASGRSDDEAVDGPRRADGPWARRGARHARRADLRLHPRPGPAARVRPDVARSPPAPAPPRRRGAARRVTARVASGVGRRPRWRTTSGWRVATTSPPSTSGGPATTPGRCTPTPTPGRHYDAALALGPPRRRRAPRGDRRPRDPRRSVRRRGRELRAGRRPRRRRDDVARIEGKLGGVHQRRGQWSTAEQHYHEALARAGRRRIAGRASPPHRRPRHHRAPAGRHRARRPAGRPRRSAWPSEAGDDAALAHTGTVAGLLAAGRGDLATARAQLAGEPRAGRRARRPRRPGGRRQRARPRRADGGRPPARRARCSWRRSRCASSIGDRHREAALRDQLAQVLHGLGRHEEAMDELKRAVAIFADIGVEGGSIQTEVWRLSEWVDHSSTPRP